MRYIHAACAVVATLALCVFLWKVYPLLQAIQTDTTRTEAEMAGVLNATRRSMITPEQVNGLVNKTNRVLDNTNIALVSMNTSIVHLDDVLTETAQVVPTLNQSVVRVTNDVDATLNDLHPIMVNTARSTDAAANILADPSIHETQTYIANLVEQSAGVATDAHTETSLLVERTRMAFKPQNKFLSLLKLVGGGTISAAEFYYYLTH